MNTQRTVRCALVLLLGLLAISGCGRSNEEQAIAAYNRGISYIEKGEFDKAIADYTEAIRLNPKNAKAYYNRGTSYAKKGEQDKADADFAKAKERTGHGAQQRPER